MENGNFWDWDNGEEHSVSAVYRDTEAETEELQEQSSQTQDIPAQGNELQNINIEQKDITPVEPVTENSFILVDNPQITPQNSTPQNNGSYVQTKRQQNGYQQNEYQQEKYRQDGYQQNEYQQNSFQQIIPLQNIQQDQGAKDQKTDFSQKDISENKAAAMAAYLLGPIGIIIALLAAGDSAYTAFHVRQALKLTVSSVALEIVAAVLALFGMIPLVGIIFKLVFVIICAVWFGVLVLRLIAIAQVCDGEAREPAIIGKMNCFH